MRLSEEEFIELTFKTEMYSRVDFIWACSLIILPLILRLNISKFARMFVFGAFRIFFISVVFLTRVNMLLLFLTCVANLDL